MDTLEPVGIRQGAKQWHHEHDSYASAAAARCWRGTMPGGTAPAANVPAATSSSPARRGARVLGDRAVPGGIRGPAHGPDIPGLPDAPGPPRGLRPGRYLANPARSVAGAAPTADQPAAGLGMQSMDLAESLDSARGADRLRDLYSRLKPHVKVPAVRDFLERASAVKKSSPSSPAVTAPRAALAFVQNE